MKSEERPTASIARRVQRDPLRGAAVLLCLSVVPEAEVGDVSRETSLCGAVCPARTGVAYDGAATHCGSDTAVSPCWWARVGEWLPSLSCAARPHSFAPVSAPHRSSPLPGRLRAIVTPSAASVVQRERPTTPSQPTRLLLRVVGPRARLLRGVSPSSFHVKRRTRWPGAESMDPLSSGRGAHRKRAVRARFLRDRRHVVGSRKPVSPAAIRVERGPERSGCFT